MNFHSFFVKCLWLSIFSIILFAYNYSFTSLPIRMSPISLYLIAVARNSSTMLDKSGKSGYHCLAPHFRWKKLTFPPLRIMLILGLSHMTSTMLKYVSSELTLLSFYNKWMLNPAKFFHCFYWNDHMIFISFFFIVVYHIHWFGDSEPYFYLQNKFYLILVNDYLNVFLDVVC